MGSKGSHPYYEIKNLDFGPPPLKSCFGARLHVNSYKIGKNYHVLDPHPLNVDYVIWTASLIVDNSLTGWMG